MRKMISLILFAIILTSCSSQLVAIKDPNLRPYSYKRPLFVTDEFYSNKGGFKKFFDYDIRNFERVSDLNKSIVRILERDFKEKQKQINSHINQNSLDRELVLNGGDPNEKINKAIEQKILKHNIDLVITIYAEEVQRTFNNGINTGVGVGINTGGNPNIGLQATTESTNLRFTYIITAVDPKTKLEVWKAKYEVENADNFITNIPNCVSKKIFDKINEDKLF